MDDERQTGESLAERAWQNIQDLVDQSIAQSVAPLLERIADLEERVRRLEVGNEES